MRMGNPQDDVECEWCNFDPGTIHTGSAPMAVLREWCRPRNYTIHTRITWEAEMRAKPKAGKQSLPGGGIVFAGVL